jgi:hypothetical protein
MCIRFSFEMEKFANFDANRSCKWCTVQPSLCSAPSSCVESGEAAAAASGVRSPSFPMQYGLMAHHKSHVLRYISNEMRTGPTLSLSH